MSGRIPLGPNEPTVNDLLYQASVIAGDGSPALAVVNTDGTSVDSISSAIGTSGAAAPAKVVQIGASDGANLHTVLVDSFGNLWANIRTALPAGTNNIGSIETTDGTNIANVIASDNGYNAQPIANSTKTLTFTTSSSGAQILLANTDCRGYGFITVVATSVGSGLAWQAQFSPNSGGTYINSQTWSNAGQAANQAGSLGASANQLYSSPIYGPYFQLNVTALSSGTLSGYVILSTQPMPYHGINSVQSGTWNVGIAASSTGGYSYNHQTANGTTTIKSGAGTLHTVVINNAGATDTITLYDNTAGSGTVIAVIGATVETTLTYDAAFSTGLTAVISGTTPPDVTFMYK